MHETLSKIGCFANGFSKARAVHDASLEEVRILEERRDTEAASLQEVERRETALRCTTGMAGRGCSQVSAVQWPSPR